MSTDTLQSSKTCCERSRPAQGNVDGKTRMASRRLAAAPYRLAEDHVSPLLQVEALRQAAGCLLQENKGHGSFRLLHHLRHTILQVGHQGMQLLPPVACGERRGGGTSGRGATTAVIGARGRVCVICMYL